MSGPTSLKRAPSCCQKHRSCHHYHYRRQCHRHRHRRNVVYQTLNVECANERGNKKNLPTIVGQTLLNGANERFQDTTGLTLVADNESVKDDKIRDESNGDEEAKERIFVSDEVDKIEEAPRLYGKTDSRTSIEINENSKRPRHERRRDDNNDDREKRVKVRNDDNNRFNWQFDFSDVLTRRHRRDDTFRRNGGQRGIASNIFLLATAGAFLALAIVAPPVSGTSSEKDEASRPRMGGTGTGTALASSPPNVRVERVPVVDTRTSSTSSTISDAAGAITGGIDLLAALQLYNTTRTGVRQVPGLARLKPAYYLDGADRDLRLNNASFERAAALLRRVPEFTVAAALRQEDANIGTIVAFSHGNYRYLELQSSGRKDELRLHYISQSDGAVHVEVFPFRLDDGEWHRLALSISGSQVELLVDCHPLYRRLLRPGPPDTNFTIPQLQLWVGQRNKHFLFKGALQDVMLIPGAHGYLSQCPQQDSSCPTCGQFSILQNTVEQLMHNLNELTRRLAAAEGRISKVEECECQKSCRSNGTVHEDGATWEKGCEQCSCVHGDIECRRTPCAQVTCKNPVIPEGQCCPVCLKQCYLRGVIYDHGEKVSPKQCTACDCYDGSFTCQRFDTKTKCPPLPCPENEQISVAEECCKFCPGVDYCAKGHECHANASCLNLQTTYACHCNIGFQGDGHKCHDVDECKQQGGSNGHHCNANTRCVNVIGGYTCECLPGYHRIDKFNCAELDECTTGHHSCSEHATCINTVGSYYCVCNDGYTGDGCTCKPMCEQGCHNGGECVSPGRCSCRRGYIGNSCELDLDECASDLHRCDSSSTCFNMPGWYYCRCKQGYRSALHGGNQGTQCLDIDECNDQTIERRHTCHPSARCVNTEGGYECSCSHRDERNTGISDPRDSSLSSENNECRLSCLYEGREIPNGGNIVMAGNSCKKCDCKDGVLTCREPVCDCNAPETGKDKCCPQCDPHESCKHQELHHLVFKSGDKWIFQCQTCECLYGEIDCWQMECPPAPCQHPVTEDGDCCPRCEDDPCARELSSSIRSSSSATINGSVLVSPMGIPQPCSYAGLLHESGSSWQDLHDKCTTCECKDGQLCCSYDYRCAGDMEDTGPLSVAPVEPFTAAVLSSGENIMRQNFDSSKAALSTSLPEFTSVPSSDRNVERRTRQGEIRKTRNDDADGNFDATTVTVNADDYPIDYDPRNPRVRDGTTVARHNTETPRFVVSTSEKRVVSRRTTIETSKRFNNPRGPSSNVPLSSATTLSSTSTTPTKTTPSIDRKVNAASTSVNSNAVFKNIPTARYSSRSNLNERKTNFASAERRRRPERAGPRLINGNPSSANDAT